MCVIWYFYRQMTPRKNPSWSEVENFVQFLNAQLSDCETSTFCMEDIVRDTLPGFRKFVVDFMVLMSKVSELCCYGILKDMFNATCLFVGFHCSFIKNCI